MHLLEINPLQEVTGLKWNLEKELVLVAMPASPCHPVSLCLRLSLLSPFAPFLN